MAGNAQKIVAAESQLINNAQPMIQRVIISDNVGVYGGGLYSDYAFM